MVEPNESEASIAALARLPIFDSRQRLWGYTIRCVTTEGAAVAPLPDQASSIASSAYMGLEEIARHGRRLVFDFTEKSVLDRLPYALPPTMAALRITEALGLEEAVLETLEGLKSDGYLIVVAGYSGREEARSLYEMAGVLSLPIESRVSRQLKERVARGRAHEVPLLASGVEDRLLLAACREIGFDLFEGGFYKSPGDIEVRRVTTSEISRFHLFRLMEADDPDFSKVAEAIQVDAGLSYRLLGFLNSAAFGLRRNITSIRHAVALLGWTRMRNWLRVALLNDMGKSEHRAELVYLAAQRGKFLESLGRRFDYWGFYPDSLQLLGLFSLLDAILCLPFDEILLHMPLEEKLKGALRGEPNNEYTSLLLLAELVEEARWEDAGALMRRLGVEEAGVRESFQLAVVWANQFAHLPSGPSE
jgi:c-di-GMP phosphodiesterase